MESEQDERQRQPEMGQGVLIVNALEKYAAKRILITKLAVAARPFQINATYSRHPTRSLRRASAPTTGMPRVRNRTQGADDNFLRHTIHKNTPSGLRGQKPPSSTNVNVKAGPVNFGGSLSGNKLTGVNVGLSGKLTKNLSGRAGIRFPTVGGAPPRASVGLNWRF